MTGQVQNRPSHPTNHRMPIPIRSLPPLPASPLHRTRRVRTKRWERNAGACIKRRHMVWSSSARQPPAVATEKTSQPCSSSITDQRTKSARKRGSSGGGSQETSWAVNPAFTAQRVQQTVKRMKHRLTRSLRCDRARTVIRKEVPLSRIKRSGLVDNSKIRIRHRPIAAH